MAETEKHEWFVIRTVAGSQRPQRTYEVEKTRGRKGYRINPTLDPGISAVERALTVAGFIHYMPAEKRLVRDRKHTDLWKPRRFALLVGYIFILNPIDFRKLEEVDGVAHLVKDVNGTPLKVDLLDILRLRQVESISEAYFDLQASRARKTIRLKAKSDPRLMKIVRKLAMIEDATVPMVRGVMAA